MADEGLSPERVIAGSDFLSALLKLGLDPEGLFWAYDLSVDEPAIVLTTSFYDQVGPLEINKLLFKAYNQAITPTSISPFLVRLQSPTDSISQTIDRLLKRLDGDTGLERKGKSRTYDARWLSSKYPASTDLVEVMSFILPGTPLQLYPTGFYIWKPAVSAGRRAGQWQKIRHNLDALAA